MLYVTSVCFWITTVLCLIYKYMKINGMDSIFVLRSNCEKVKGI